MALAGRCDGAVRAKRTELVRLQRSAGSPPGACRHAVTRPGPGIGVGGVRNAVFATAFGASHFVRLDRKLSICYYRLNQVMRRVPIQLELRARTWGGKRSGAGRKPTGRKVGVPHRARPGHDPRHPAHVTLRASKDVASLRGNLVFRAIESSLARASHSGLRVLHFSVQRDHVHLVVEAADRRALSRGLQGLAIRIAKRVNRILGRRGPVWADRFHARALRTPREVRNALVYVLQNWRKHVRGARGLDWRSSAMWFEGWARPISFLVKRVSPVVGPRTWLAAVGWRRLGLIHFDERPAPACARRRTA